MARSKSNPPIPGRLWDIAGTVRLALSGRVVTMNAQFDVLDPGTVYVEDGAIIAVQPSAAPAPPGFAGVGVVATGGTIFPGMIELHNHLAYNALPLWQVPKLYNNRDQWRGTRDYETLISRPMGLLGTMQQIVLAICRYVECKCLVGGVTTSQGIRLVSNAGISKYFRGVIRTVEQPSKDKRLVAAAALISDPDAKDPKKFWAALQKQSKKGGEYLLHLSEGTDASARKHFLSLEIDPGVWAIDRALAGIHCAALGRADFDTMAAHDGSIVWSPFSNLLLYGRTADAANAKAAGVRIGLGPDWSPSGSKNLFGELKVAKVWSDNNGGVFSARELVAMATRDAASILRWDTALGSLETAKRADLVVVDVPTGGDPYEGLIAAKETAIRLVVVDGVTRYGVPDLMSAFRSDGEHVRMGGRWRVFNLAEAPGDPDVAAVSFAKAEAMLGDALNDLPQLQADTAHDVMRALAQAGPKTSGWNLALDELGGPLNLRPRLPMRGTQRLTGPSRAADERLATAPIVLKPLRLDPPTVADDPAFLESLAQQANLPDYVKEKLGSLY